MTTLTKPPIWFWIVSGLLLVWNLMGVAAYLAQVYMSPEALAALPEAEQTLYEAVPAWATAAFAIAVFAGAIGCVGLLLRKAWAIPVFYVSLAGVLVQDIYNFFIGNTMEVYGASAIAMPIVVLVILLGTIWFARKAKESFWIG